MLNQNSVMPFGKIPPGALFKVLKPETIHSLVTRQERVVSSPGSYIKMCDAYSVNVATYTDAIFLKSMPCRIIPKPPNFDTWYQRRKELLSNRTDWAIINHGRPKS